MGQAFALPCFADSSSSKQDGFFLPSVIIFAQCSSFVLTQRVAWLNVCAVIAPAKISFTCAVAFVIVATASFSCVSTVGRVGISGMDSHYVSARMPRCSPRRCADDQVTQRLEGME